MICCRFRSAHFSTKISVFMSMKQFCHVCKLEIDCFESHFDKAIQGSKFGDSRRP